MEAQKELNINMDKLKDMERPELLTEKQWRQVLDRAAMVS